MVVPSTTVVLPGTGGIETGAGAKIGSPRERVVLPGAEDPDGDRAVDRVVLGERLGAVLVLVDQDVVVGRVAPDLRGRRAVVDLVGQGREQRGDRGDQRLRPRRAGR